MQPYQEEYIANLKEIASLTMRKDVNGLSFEDYYRSVQDDRSLLAKKVKANMQLLRSNLFPFLDQMYMADEAEKEELFDFAEKLMNSSANPDVGLFCQVHRILLSCARQTKDRNAMIKELYWLGIGYNKICSRLIVMNGSEVDKYSNKMRLYFTEAAAYLKYYDEIDDTETRGYILRSRANMSLGRFKTVSEKVQMIKRSLLILQDKEYQEKAPELPWDRFISLAHQQMASSMTRSKSKYMSPQDVEDIMESVYIIYQSHLKEAEENGTKLPARVDFSCYSIEHQCGIRSLEELLKKMEELMDNTDTSDFSSEGIYGIISLPAFYCQYLTEYPEFIPKHKRFLEDMYRRVIDYIDNFSDLGIIESLFYSLRQLSYTFLETDGSISYKEFLQKVQIRFAPDIYVHSWAVGRAAAAFCEIITEEEPNFFDDIDFIKQIDDPSAKKEAIISYAMDCGIFHDAGKMNFMNLYCTTGRQWFEEEYEMAQLHTLSGMVSLSQRPSTLPYAQIALGHHSWYDGSQGCEVGYKRLECQYRQMVDVIGLIDRLDTVTDSTKLYTGREYNFEEAVQKAIDEEGRRFSPMLTARLRDKSTCDSIYRALLQGDREACERVYETCRM